MQRVPSLSTLVAIARVLAARRALEMQYGGIGEVRYATSAAVPSFLSEAIARAGAALVERDGEVVRIPAQPAGIAAIIDVAFSELAHHARGTIGVVDLGVALRRVEATRRAAPLDRDKEPDRYWAAVLELAALAGELARNRGARWVETHLLPVPFALRFPEAALAYPTTIAQKIVEGGGDDTLAEPADT